MDRALFAAATGMAAQQQNLDTIADNLANADVAGFKGSAQTFAALAAPGEPGVGTASLGAHAIFTQGKLERGNGPFDVAIDGSGFFVLERGRERAYTRDGEFSRAADGTLRNADGWALQGVRIPADALKATVADDGRVQVTTAQGTRDVARLHLALFPAPEQMQNIGGTLFRETPASGHAVLQQPGGEHGPHVRFGMLERSNVTIIDAMMQILAAQRAYEANAKGVAMKSRQKRPRMAQSIPKRVAAYLRVSSAGSRDRDLSIPEQERQIREFCDRHGWTVVAVYSDEAKSGASVENRPQFLTMLRAARSKPRPFDLILARDQSRFGRSYRDGAIREELRELGIAIDNVHSPSGDCFGQLTLASEMTEAIQDAVNVNYRKTQARLMIQGMEAKARRGGFTGAQATCYGYKQEWVSVNGGKPTRKPVPDKQKSKVVREIFRRYIGGSSLKEISRWLNASGIKAPRGIAWYDSTVRAILKNETYLGRLVYGRVKKVKHPITRAPMNTFRDEADVIRVDDAFPAIIDQKTFVAAQAILSRNERTRPEGGNPANTLQGIGKCSVCGWHLAFQRHSGSGRWYYMCGYVKQHKARNADPRCKGIIYADYVDSVVRLFLRRILNTKVTDIREQVARFNAAAENLEGLSRTEELDIAIRDREEAIKRIVEAVANAGGSEALLRRLAAEEEALVALRRKRTELLAAVNIQKIDSSEIIEARASVKEALRANDTEQMRAVLSAICSVVQVDWSQRKSDRIAFNYLFEDLRAPRQISTSRDEVNAAFETLKATGNLEKLPRVNAVRDLDKLPDVDPLTPSQYRVHITVTGAPLTFVPRWSITNAERATDDAIARVAAALS